MREEFDTKKCPFARKNPHYPFEGFTSEYKCVLKPSGGLFCENARVGQDCLLLRKMMEDPVFKDFMIKYFGVGE